MDFECLLSPDYDRYPCATEAVQLGHARSPLGDTAGQSALHASGAVAVFPNDVIVGDIDGIVVIPHHLAEEIAVDAAEQESLEEFIFKRIEAGVPLTGPYPPNEATKEAYVVWKRQNVSGNATAVR